jgi:carbamoyl-phosphate synthase small subunit
MVVMTYPLIGNYGIHEGHFESQFLALKALLVKEINQKGNLLDHGVGILDYLLNKNIPIMSEIDTRKLVRVIRHEGTLKACLSTDPNKHPRDLATESWPKNQVEKVSTPEVKNYPNNTNRGHIVVIDYGVKTGIIKSLLQLGYQVSTVPYNYHMDDIRKLKPHGILLSNGPGDPKDVKINFEHLLALKKEFPMMGICLGHQLLALAHGANTQKMLFGHRGANHPVKDLKRDKFFMSSQNHSYEISPGSLNTDECLVNFSHLNDESIEGIQYKSDQCFSVQFHPEANPGPNDSSYLFKDFDQLITNFWEGRNA